MCSKARNMWHADEIVVNAKQGEDRTQPNERKLCDLLTFFPSLLYRGAMPTTYTINDFSSTSKLLFDRQQRQRFDKIPNELKNDFPHGSGFSSINSLHIEDQASHIFGEKPR